MGFRGSINWAHTYTQDFSNAYINCMQNFVCVYVHSFLQILEGVCDPKKGKEPLPQNEPITLSYEIIFPVCLSHHCLYFEWNEIQTQCTLAYKDLYLKQLQKLPGARLGDSL